MDTPQFSLSYPSLKEINFKEVSYGGMFMLWHSVTLKVAVSIRKQNVNAIYVIIL
jgi:hypothetical protein